jgi:uncharacterized protein (TIGR00255 family)
MSIRSMTGYAHVQQPSTQPNGAAGTLSVEIKSVNARFREIQIRAPKSLNSYETTLRNKVTEYVSRGTVIVAVSGDSEQDKPALTWDKAAVDNLMQILGEIKETYGLTEPITFATLLQCGDILISEKNEADANGLLERVTPLLEDALVTFQQSREEEGVHIAQDIRKSCGVIEETITRIQKRAPERIRKYTESLEQKINNFALQTDMTPERLSTEIAIMADKIDINEECVRLKAHLEKCLSFLECDTPVGKQLNFLLQEMGREANTIGAKANDAEISHDVVTMKEHVEKMREHVQNVE